MAQETDKKGMIAISNESSERCKQRVVWWGLGIKLMDRCDRELSHFRGKGSEISIKLPLPRRSSFPPFAFFSSSGKSGNVGFPSPGQRLPERDAEDGFNANSAAGDLGMLQGGGVKASSMVPS